MSRQVDPERILIFTLEGKVGSYLCSNDGPDPFVGERLKEEIHAETQAEGIEKARARVALFLQTNASITPPSAPGGWESTYEFSLTQKVWDMRFVREVKHVPAVKAIAAHKKEVVRV